MSKTPHQEREARLVHLIALRAPDAVLVVMARAYLSSLEGGTWQAMRRWAAYRIRLDFEWAVAVVRMWFLTRVRGMTPDEAEAHVFGPE